MEEIAPGVMHWQAPHPSIGADVSSYWLPQLRTLLDPLAVPDEVDGVQHILLSCRHHVRDSLEVRTRFGAVVRAPRTGMHEFEEDTPIVPYDFGESLAGGAVIAHEVNAISPDETAFHIPAVNALAIADGAIRYGDDLHFVPDEYMDDPEETKDRPQAGLRPPGRRARLRRPAARTRHADRERRPRGAAALFREMRRSLGCFLGAWGEFSTRISRRPSRPRRRASSGMGSCRSLRPRARSRWSRSSRVPAIRRRSDGLVSR